MALETKTRLAGIFVAIAQDSQTTLSSSINRLEGV